MTKKFPPHPAALLMPRPTEAEKAELRADIEANGLLDPIELYEGQVIDGVTRQDLCLELGIEMSSNYLQITAHDLGPHQCPYQYVRSKHTRRNLKPSQWAAIGQEIREASKSSRNAKSVNLDKAAKMVGVSPRLIGQAATVKKLGCKEAFEAVKEGRAKVGAMEQLVKAVPDREEQRKILTSANPKEEVKQRISGGVTFDVEEIEGAPQEGERKRKNGAPLVLTKDRKEAVSLVDKLSRVLQRMGLYEQFISPISQIRETLTGK